VIKASNGHGGYWTKGFAVADDFEEPDGTHVLTFHQAGDAGKALARGKADTADSKPMTVADALARYKIDLKSRGGHLSNATRVEKHLTSTLAGKPVALLTVRDLQTWRNGLKEKMEPSSVNRTRTGLRAALELAATLDHRITNRHVFRLGLRGLPGSNKARRIVLPDADVLRILKAAYEVEPAFGLLVEVLAVTGARLSQAARLTCADLQADRPDPRLMMPSSFKGRGQKKISHRPVPITPTHRCCASATEPHGRRRPRSITVIYFDALLSGLNSVLLGSPVTRCDIHRSSVRCSVASRSRSPRSNTIPACVKLKHTTPPSYLTTPMRSRGAPYSTRRRR